MSSSDDDSLGDISDTQDSDGNQSFGGDEDSNQSSSDDEITFNTRSNNDGVKIMEASEEVEPVDDLKEQDDDKNNNSSKSEFPSWKGDRLYPTVRHSSNPSRYFFHLISFLPQQILLMYLYQLLPCLIILLFPG